MASCGPSMISGPTRNVIILSVRMAAARPWWPEHPAIRAQSAGVQHPGSEAPAYLDTEVRLVEVPSNDDRADCRPSSARFRSSIVVGMEGATLEPDEPMPEPCRARGADGLVSVYCRRSQDRTCTAPASRPRSTRPWRTTARTGPAGSCSSGAARWGVATVPCRGRRVQSSRSAGCGWWYDSDVDRFELDVAPSVEAAFFVDPNDRSKLPGGRHFIRSVLGSRQAATSSSRWAWDFGDGTGSDEQYAIHRYAELPATTMSRLT